MTGITAPNVCCAAAVIVTLFEQPLLLTPRANGIVRAAGMSRTELEAVAKIIESYACKFFLERSL
jgi:hypothetical protein